MARFAGADAENAVSAAVTAGEPCGEVESVKSVSDLYSPVDGEVVEINTKLANQPELVNSSPYDEGWMVRVKPSSLSEIDSLMDSEAYRRHVGG